MGRILLAFQWFFSILFGDGAARLAALEERAGRVDSLEAALKQSKAAGAPSAPAPAPAPAPVAAPAPAPVAAPVSAPPAKPQAPAPAAGADTLAAVQLLALLQTEARLVDFVLESIDAYTDEQVGAGVRAVHAGCRRVLRELVKVEPVLAAAEGERVTVPAGFDPATIRLVGHVSGQPPFAGTLQHHGWRVVSLSLPSAASVGATRVVAPAEVEV